MPTGRIYTLVRRSTVMKFRIVTEYDPETESYSAYCPELPGCCSAGDSEEEALKNAVEAIKLYLEHSPLSVKAGKSAHTKVHKVEINFDSEKPVPP
jgi:predicted RNase H-like HicB family nuclease